MSNVTNLVVLLAIVCIFFGAIAYAWYSITQWLIKRRYKQEDDKSRRELRQLKEEANG